MAIDLPGTRALLRSRGGLVACVVMLGAAWRLWLGAHYAGWEESDYGNLAMVRGVLDGGFRHYDMNHMPGYYALGAAALAVVGDTVWAAKLVSGLGGLAALGMAVGLTDRLAGRRAALWTAAVLLVQPEFALYAASSLREPVYAAFVVACVGALSRERLAWAGVAAGAAFLVRFDAALVLGPVLLIHACGRGPRLPRAAAALAPLALAVAGWSVYTRVDHGTFAFWSHAVAVNVETGLGAESTSTVEWAAAGLGVAGTLVGWVLPWRLGWGVWLGLGVALLAVPWRRHGPQRTVALAGLLLLGLWAGIGFTGQHEPGHNLYWKWMLPLVPVLVPLGVTGALAVVDRVGARVAPMVSTLLLGGLVLQGVGSNLKETARQVGLSARLYAPQLALGRWIEREVPPDQPLLVDNIPACWLARRPHERELTSWFDVPSRRGDPAAFAEWIRDAEIGWVLWFREEWTQAPGVAPFLEGGGRWVSGGTVLQEVAREDAYGWILFRVEGVARGTPPGPDAGGGALPPTEAHDNAAPLGE